MEIVNLKGTYLNLKIFIAEIRNLDTNDINTFNDSFKKLWELKYESLQDELNQFTNELLQNAFFASAFAEYGINSNSGFFTEISAKLKHKILPVNLPDDELSHYISFLLDESDDYIWLNKISLQNWQHLFNSIGEIAPQNEVKLQIQICNALTILCNRLTTLAIDPVLSIKFPNIDDLGSPFFNLSYQLNVATNLITSLTGNEVDAILIERINKSITAIESLFITIQQDIKESGTSLNLIFLLKRGQQHIERIKLLSQLLFTKKQQERAIHSAQIICLLVEAEKLKNSIRQFFKTHIQLLAFRVVSHTSKKGESYIGFNRAENKALFKSAMGGGLVVVFLVYIKHFIHQLHLSLFFEGLLFGLNYGLGFVIMHLLHFTLATKQPALTASFIAENIENSDEKSNKSKKVFSQILRSQFVSLFGNLVIVIPLCFISAYFIFINWDLKIFSSAEAHQVMMSNHLFYSLSLFYAVITGVFLSLSSLVIGYIDNKVIYAQIGLRIEKHPAIIKKYNPEKRKEIALFFENNLGAIVGNLFLGFSLGMAGNIGAFIGIPFDIRHITISAGNFSLALLNYKMHDWALILIVFFSIILIGIINIMVSFLISFILACGSRGLSWKQSIKLLLKAA